jgi:hypothetical protein
MSDAVRGRSFPILGALALSLMLLSCRDTRLFPSEQKAIAHFRAHRETFDAMAKDFLSTGLTDLSVDDKNAATPSGEQIHIPKDLQIVRITAVPQLGQVAEQYIEFELRGTPSAPYGFIFVPEGRKGAMDTIESVVASPPRTGEHAMYQTMHRIEGRWFYFDYQ